MNRNSSKLSQGASMEALSGNAGSRSSEGIFRFKFMVGKREGSGSGGCTKVTGRRDWKGREA